MHHRAERKGEPEGIAMDGRTDRRAGRGGRMVEKEEEEEKERRGTYPSPRLASDEND